MLQIRPRSKRAESVSREETPAERNQRIMTETVFDLGRRAAAILGAGGSTLKDHKSLYGRSGQMRLDNYADKAILMTVGLRVDRWRRVQADAGRVTALAVRRPTLLSGMPVSVYATVESYEPKLEGWMLAYESEMTVRSSIQRPLDPVEDMHNVKFGTSTNYGWNHRDFNSAAQHIDACLRYAEHELGDVLEASPGTNGLLVPDTAELIMPPTVSMNDMRL